MQSATLGDAELIERSCLGDRDAFGELVGRYQDVVCAITYSVIGDLDLSEDLAQETFVSAWRRLESLREPSKLRAWLCTIARNKARDAVQKQSRDGNARVVSVEAVVSEGPAAPRAAGPDERAIGREEEELLWKTLARLPERFREPLVLYYRKNKSVREVSECLDLSREAVRQRLARGRAELKKEIAEFVEEGLRCSGPGKAFSAGVILALATTSPQLAAATIAGKGAVAAKTTGLAATIGAWFGPVVGVLGGVFGTWASYRSARSPRERRFVLRMAGILVLYILVFFGALAASWYWLRGLSGETFVISQVLLWGAYLVGLLAFIVQGNRRQKRIQIEEGTYREPLGIRARDQSQGFSRSAVYGSLAGDIFGSLAWLVGLAFRAGDALGVALLIAGGFVLFVVSSRILLPRGRAAARRVYLGVLTGILALTAITAQLRLIEWLAATSERTVEEVARSLPLWGIHLLLAVIGLGIGGLIWRQFSPPRREGDSEERGSRGG